MATCEIDILIVEDDESSRDGWRRDVRDFNRTQNRPFDYRPTFASSKREALNVLSRSNVDCAVIDLRLPNGEEDANDSKPLGNDVLQALIEEIGIPAFVYSGYDGEASDAVRASNIRVLEKQGGGGAKILEEFAAQAGLMAAMKSTRNRIAKEIARLFSQSIWHRWESRWSSEEDRDVIEGIIARQTASHIADSLARPPLSHHPDEFYLVPALTEDRLDTGDLLEQNGHIYVVLTPRCNMANKPPGHLMLAVCDDLPDWPRWKEDLVNGGTKKKEKAERDLRSHATQGHSIATHFLPPLDERGPWLVNFQEVRTISSEETPQLIESRFASVAPHFIPNLVQRYSAYLGRIGQPDLDTDILSKLCKH